MTGYLRVALALLWAFPFVMAGTVYAAAGTRRATGRPVRRRRRSVSV